MALSRFFLQLHQKNESHHEDPFHYYRDEKGDFFPLSPEEITMFCNSGHHHLSSSRVLPPEHNDKLSIHLDNLNKLLQLHLINQNTHCEGNYDIDGMPNLSSNSYSSLSLNSAGKFSFSN